MSATTKATGPPGAIHSAHEAGFSSVVKASYGRRRRSSVLILTGAFNLSTPTEVKALPGEYYQRFLSDMATSRTPSPIRALFPLESPNVISLLAGKPNPASFPITNMQITVRTAADAPNAPGTLITIGDEQLAAGLQYGATDGYKPLIEWLKGLQERSHKRKEGEGWRITMGSGSQDSLYKAFCAILNPGDSILVESPAYAGVLPMFDELDANIIPIQTDHKGIRPSVLRETLENWPVGKPMPKALYTVPYGCNPTGMTTSEDRRRVVLELAAKYNFLILEDDPYYYLYYGDTPRPKSYFALERERPEVGRVLRFDSMSKVLSSGMRIGFASGPTPLLDAMDMHTATANMQVSSFTQVVMHEVLKSWGYDAFLKHTVAVSQFYREKKDVFDAAMQRHLSGLVEYTPPVAGMFFWFRLLLKDGAADSEEIIRDRAYKKGVLALPGISFMPDGKPTAYVRASFSLLERDVVDEACRRLRDVLLEEQE